MTFRARYKNKSNIGGYIIRSVGWVVLLSFIVVAVTWAFNASTRSPSLPGQARTLTFAERVHYQRTIEEVYWRHRIWPKNRSEPKPSLDAVMPQAEIEKKVQAYLYNSQALEVYWQKPITPKQLQAEMDRMAQHTKQPKVLREIFRALDDDPVVIAECLARPVLSQRLLTELHNQRDRVLTKVGWSNRAATSSIVRAGKQSPLTRPVNTSYTLPVISDPSGVCTGDTWISTNLADAPSARASHTAVWTGSEMIVWGGVVGPNTYTNTGGRYDPSTDTWAATSVANAPDGRASHTAVWTGSEMIVWGGNSGGTNRLNTGGRYSPGTDSWVETSTTNAPTGRDSHTALWTGDEMIIWGGIMVGSYLNTGGRYNPGADTWVATSTANVPSARFAHTAVWTGSEMIVWGGYTNGNATNTGGRYDLSTDSWTATSTNNVTDREYHTAVWTGSEMIVWAGYSHTTSSDTNTGARYDPVTDIWTVISITSAPTARERHTAVWTANQMVAWGGQGFGPFYNTGGRYDPSTDTWTATSTTNAPAGREAHSAVWTGSEMIVWGGSSTTFTFLNTGGKYCAQSGQTPTPSPSPTATASATATSTPRPRATPRLRPTPYPRP